MVRINNHRNVIIGHRPPMYPKGPGAVQYQFWASRLHLLLNIVNKLWNFVYICHLY